MKLLIASDIHGSSFYLHQLMEAYQREKAEKMLLLGDLLYHGPRNDLPKEYAPKEIIPVLNSLKNELICVRGNCDTEVDQMVLEFPILSDYALLYLNGITILATHGHRYGPSNPPPMSDGTYLFCGHTHVPACEKHENFIYCNPGSVSIPKNNSPHSYILMEEGGLYWKNLEGETFLDYTFPVKDKTKEENSFS